MVASVVFVVVVIITMDMGHQSAFPSIIIACIGFCQHPSPPGILAGGRVRKRAGEIDESQWLLHCGARKPALASSLQFVSHYYQGQRNVFSVSADSAK
ncbi:hypothetical protein EJB05_19309, partial [Eragrostis curvula]